MKNQLRKATLRAAALTMSATIAATSVPMTAFAEEGNDGQKDDGSQQVSTAKSAEAQVSDKESTTSDDIATANKEVGDIKSAAQAAGIATGEGTDVDMAETNVAKAVENEKTVAADVKTIVDSKEAEDGINASEYAIEELISKKKDIVEKENKNQKDIDKDIADAEEAIKNKANKEEADSIVEGANEKITSGNKSYTKAENDIAELDKDYEKEMSNLEAKQKKYSEAVSNGVIDIEKVEEDITNAKTNVTDLQNQVTNLTTEVNNMSTEVKKTAVEELADKYNDAKRTPEGTKELFEAIVTEYSGSILGEGVTDVKVGSYNKDYNAYEVTFKKGDKEETAYLSYVTNDNDNGITVSKVTKREVVDKEGYDAYYKHGNTVFSETEYEKLVEDGKVVEQKEKNGKITSYYIENVKLIDFYKEGTVTDNNGKEVTTTISNKRTVVTNNGSVQIYGNVETITKTTTPLDVKSENTYADRTSAESAANALKDQYESNGYEDVQVELITNDAKLQYTATAVFVDKLSFSDTIEDSNDHEYRTGEFLTEKNKEPIFFWQDRDKYVLGTSYVSNTRTYNDKVWDFWPIYYHYETKTEEISKTWTVDYAEVSKETVDYNPLDAIGDFIKNFTGKEKKSISVQEAVDKKLIANGGYVVGFEPVDGNLTKATVYCVKGTKVEATGDSEEAAQAALAELLKSKQMSGARFDTTSSVIVPESYSYKITGTKTSTLTVNEYNKKVSDSYENKASKLKYHEGQETTYKNVFDSEKAYDNSFLDTAKNDKTKRLEEEEKLSNEKTAKQKTLGELNTQLTEASKALEKAKTDSAELKKQVAALNTTASTIGANIKLLKENYSNLKLDSNGTEGRKQKIEDAYNNLPNRPSNNGGNNNGGGSSNNNNNNNNQPGLPTLPAGPIATTNTTPTQQVVTLVDDQTPLSATADDTVAPKTNKKAAKKNAAKTTDSDSKKTNKNNTKKQPKKVTPEVEDDTIDEDLEIVSLDDNDQVPLAPGVASNDSTKDIMDETASVSWLWLIILAVASVVTFGTYKGVKKHNENKGKNNR